MIDVNGLIEKWTQEERAAIYGALEKINLGSCVKLDDSPNHVYCLRFKGDIPAKSCGAVSNRAFMALKPGKLVILETTFEQITHEVTITSAKIEKKWWRTRIIEPQRTTTTEHKKLVTVPRSTWRIRGAFMGANVQFPTQQDISGDLFGPDGQFRFLHGCPAGIDITLQVENLTSQAMPFYAVLLAEEQLQPENDHDFSHRSTATPVGDAQ